MGDPNRRPLATPDAVPRLAADANVSVDVDTLDCYRAIHGLDSPPSDGPDSVWTTGVRRAMELFDHYELSATFFVVGADLQQPAHRRVARQLVEAGHEVANHSLEHPYDLREFSEPELAHQIEEADRLIEAATGQRPVGFRTPGYNVDADIIAFLRRAGHRYDASVFPCVSYWLAKAAVMRWRRLTDRPSRSAVTDPANLSAPRQPYFPDPLDCHRPAGEATNFVEIPVASFALRLIPVIGTSLHLLDRVGLQRIWPWIDRSFPRFFSLEMHAIDFLGPADLTDVPDGDALLAHQPDLRIPFGHKAPRYRSMLEAICQSRTPATLAEATRSLVGQSSDN